MDKLIALLFILVPLMAIPLTRHFVLVAIQIALNLIGA